MNIHPRARTTPALRKEIHEAKGTLVEIAKRYNVSVLTVRKWKQREDFHDKSHRPHRLRTTLTEAQEYIVIELRKTLLLTLDDLFVVTRRYLNENVSRAGLHRCLQRHGVSNLNALKKALDEGAGESKKKRFKDYEPGFLHIDLKYLPQMPEETHRQYLMVAIDRATRWVYLEVVKDKSATQAEGFLERAVQKAPFKVYTVLTDNGKEFTDRFSAQGERAPTGRHAFDRRCQAQGIEHRLIKPKHPQTNGMVERFNGRISDILKRTRFTCAADLHATLEHYLKLYNHHLPQKALGHLTPVEALKEWRKKKPDIFVKRVYKQARPDT